jgi:hypothetical protein
MKTFNITYNFSQHGNKMKVIELSFDAETFDLLNETPEKLPHWANLDYHKCPNCLLSLTTNAFCSVAAHFFNLLELLHSLMSYEQIQLDIFTPQRIFTNRVSAQKAISSLMGLVIATSGCPHTRFFRPMAARFHLPFTDAEETIYRAVSMYLLAQYFR